MNHTINQPALIYGALWHNRTPSTNSKINTAEYRIHFSEMHMKHLQDWPHSGQSKPEYIFKGQVIQGMFSDHMELSLKSVTKREKNPQLTAN